jgi:FeS assembly protein IscX
MRWNDIEDIAEALEEHYPDEEIEMIRLADLHDLIITLNDFDDSLDSNDRVLEAVREAWLELRI